MMMMFDRSNDSAIGIVHRLRHHHESNSTIRTNTHRSTDSSSEPPLTSSPPTNSCNTDDSYYSTSNSGNNNSTDIMAKERLPFYHPNSHGNSGHKSNNSSDKSRHRHSQSHHPQLWHKASLIRAHTKQLRRVITQISFTILLITNVSLMYQHYIFGTTSASSRTTGNSDGNENEFFDGSSTVSRHHFMRRQLLTITGISPLLQPQHFLPEVPTTTTTTTASTITPTIEPTTISDFIIDTPTSTENSHNNSEIGQQKQKEQQNPEKIKYYSSGRHDRSGAVVHDMMWVHAYAYSQNGVYGGACGGPQLDRYHNHATTSMTTATNPIKIMTYQNVTQELIDQLHWDVALKYDCPYNYQNSSTTVLVDRDFYTDLNATVFTPSWKRYFQQQIEQSKQNSIMTATTTTSEISESNTASATQSDSNVHDTMRSDLSITGRTNNNTIDDIFTIAVHIRRGDVDPCTYMNRYLSNDYYLEIIKEYYKLVPTQYKTIVVNIYSESQTYESFDVFRDVYRYNVHLDDTLYNVWRALSTADIAILSKSSFSYVPAIVNPNKVVYTSYRHLPLPSWEVVDVTKSDKAKRQVLALHQSKCGRGNGSTISSVDENFNIE